MGQTLPYSSAVVVTSQRLLADDMRQFLSQIGVPFVHTPTDLDQARSLFRDDAESLAVIHCDEYGGSVQLLLEELSLDANSRLRPLILLVDEVCAKLKPMVLELQVGVALDSLDWQSHLVDRLSELSARQLPSIKLQERYLAACFLRNSKEYQDAEAILLELLDEVSDCVAIALDLAEVYREQNRHDEAIAILQELVDAEDAHAGVWHCLAICCEQKKRWSRAIEHWQSALAQNPYHSYRRLRLADALQEDARFDEAVTHYLQLVQENLRQKPAALGVLQCLLVQADEISQSQEWQVALTPTELASHCNTHAARMAREGKLREAAFSLRQAIYSLRDQPEYLAKLIFNLGVIWASDADPLGSYLCFGIASQLDPGFSKALSNWREAQLKAKCELPELSTQQAVDWLLSNDFPQSFPPVVRREVSDSQQSPLI